MARFDFVLSPLSTPSLFLLFLVGFINLAAERDEAIICIVLWLRLFSGFLFFSRPYLSLSHSHHLSEFLTSLPSRFITKTQVGVSSPTSPCP